MNFWSQILVRIGEEVAVFGRYLRSVQEIDESDLRLRVRRSYRHREFVKPRFTSLFQNCIADFDAVLGVDPALLDQLDVARPADRKADIAKWNLCT